MAILINVRYEGLDADKHQLDMALFGKSLIGLDRTLSVGLTALTLGHVPRPRERFLLTVKASPPEHGCVDLNAIINTASPFLPFITSLLNEHGSEIAWHFLSASVKQLGGKKPKAEEHITALTKLLKEVHEGQKLEKQDRQLEREHVERVIETMKSPMRNFVAPVGSSCDYVRITSERKGTTELDVPMAQAIRSNEPLEVGELTTMRVKVDGITVHNHTLKVELDDAPGKFITADVRDPAFELEGNVYVTSVSKYLEIIAKPTYRDGELVKLHISDAKATD